MISAEQIEDGKKETNDRLLGVAIHSYDHEGLETIDDIGKTLLSQLEEFFVSYNKQRGTSSASLVPAARRKHQVSKSRNQEAQGRHQALKG